MLRTRTLKIAPGDPQDYALDGDYLRIKQAAVPVIVETPDGDSIEMVEGEEIQLEDFKRLHIYHNDAAEQTIKIVIGKNGARLGSAKVSGSVTVSGSVEVTNDAGSPLPVTVSNQQEQQGAFASTQKTVTSASASLVAANAARRYLEIQNKDSAGSIFVNVAGVAATTANGRKIVPGESWIVSGYVPNGQVFAIGEAASNANIVVIEG